ncbi:NAD(P)/FAD-dependent oxidoreductase [Hartmannibacter diazotrophicus]|nr:FAD-binding oxidoreductase [Hartmannibacter diazotrophicus]
MPEFGGADHAPSWYAASAGAIPSHPPLIGDVAADVAIIGGGFAGLGAALRLAERGRKVVLLEANKIGWGASGRNGGQIHPGQRRDPDWMAERLGEDAARELLRLADFAREHQRELIARHDIDCDLCDGLIEAVHRKRDLDHVYRHGEHLTKKWGLGPYQPLDAAQIAAKLGTDAYFGGLVDPTGGHLHPLKYALGLARAAVQAGAILHEQSRVLSIDHGDKVRLKTKGGSVTADLLLMAGNGYLNSLDADLESRILPLNNFVLATEPLPEGLDLIPGNEAAADTRNVVYYWRMTPDRRLLFGGGETFGTTFPADIKAFVRRHMLKIYPQLKETGITHAWGGTLGITVNRLPYLARPKPNVFVTAGFSGQGVMMAPFAGHLAAEAMAGLSEGFDAFSRLPCPPFPGGKLLRLPTQVAAMTFFALLDRL